MPSITIYGASDDLIEVEGDIREEFNHYSDDDADDPDAGAFLCVSDGTVLRAVYDRDGIWRITPVVKGRAEFAKVEGNVEADTNDRVTLTAEEPFKYVALASRIARAKNVVRP